MTHSAIKPSNLETTTTEKSTCDLISTHFAINHIVLDKSESYIIESPLNGFLNLIVSNDQSSCIIPYFLKQNSFIIRADQNIIHAVEIGDKLEWKNINNTTAIAIYISKDYLESLKIKFQKYDERFKNGLLTKSDSRTILICNQILELNRKNDHFANLRILSSIIELLIHQIEGIFVENENKQLIINKDHYEKIIQAKQIIEKDFSKNYTIAELSKLVGTNEQYLKKYFKQHFGKTIMNYSTDQKMQHAKELIMTGDYRVSDVARMTGYKHSTHFTTAFKKYFGFIPNSLRYTFLIANEGTQQIISEIESIINIL